MPYVREANEADAPAMATLLREHNLQAEGLLEVGTVYWVAEEDGYTIGAVGLELGETAVLLRSAIVHPEWRGLGVGKSLTEAALDWSCEAGYRVAYCFSTEAGHYWLARGFEHCPVEDVLRDLPDAPQVRLFLHLGWLSAEAAFRIRLSPL